MQTQRILLVVTSNTHMGDSPHPTGSWLEEIAAPYYVFSDARCHVTLASSKGGAAPIDAVSLREENLTASTRRFQADPKAKATLAVTWKLADLNAEDFDAVFFAGGHGTMEDFANEPCVTSLVEAFYNAGKPVSALCHGPACLVNARKANGEPLIRNHRFACFTDAEEKTIGFETLVPFLLESRLTELGGIAVTASPFTRNVVVDRNLITGQNPASAICLAESVVHRLRNIQAPRHAA